MDRKFLLKYLALADQHVILGKECLDRQRLLAAKLEIEGQDPTVANELLAYFEKIQASHVSGRDRLLQELHRVESESVQRYPRAVSASNSALYCIKAKHRIGNAEC